MNQPDQLKNLHTLCTRARDLSDQIGAQLDTGTAPETLVPHLQALSETIVQFQTDFSQFAQTEDAAEDIEHFKNEFLSLVQAAEQHVQKARQKGVRLTGIGGKPHRPSPGKKP